MVLDLRLAVEMPHPGMAFARRPAGRIEQVRNPGRHEAVGDCLACATSYSSETLPEGELIYTLNTPRIPRHGSLDRRAIEQVTDGDAHPVRGNGLCLCASGVADEDTLPSAGRAQRPRKRAALLAGGSKDKDFGRIGHCGFTLQ